MRISGLRKKFSANRITPEAFKSRRRSKSVKIRSQFRTFGKGAGFVGRTAISGVSASRQAIKAFRETRTANAEKKQVAQIAKEEREIAKLNQQIKLEKLREQRTRLQRKGKRGFRLF